MRKRIGSVGGRLAPLVLALLVLWLPAASQVAEVRAISDLEIAPPEPIDRLAEPVLPESPTQVDIGRNLYYFHCMPCHGDRGQGLTDEWRGVWVEDHQNCWGRGCHTGKSEIDAFYLPRFVPAVSGSPVALGAFGTAEDLYAFLQKTQPPQRPGALTEREYWALTAFLLHENGRLAAAVEEGRQMLGGTVASTDAALGLLAPLLALFCGAAVGSRRKGWVSKAR